MHSYYISDVIGKHYLMIREVIKRIVVEVLFNPSALDEYLQDVQNNMNKLLNMGKLFIMQDHTALSVYHMILRVC